jgi:hypothetical protein
LEALEAELAGRLNVVQNADGGWGVTPGETSITDATALSVLALRDCEPTRVRAGSSVERGRSWLTMHQRPDGGWPVSAAISESSWMTSLALLAMLALGGEEERVAQAGEWLAALEGRRLGWLRALLFRLVPEDRRAGLDPGLRGWPWRAGSFAWVEPSSLAILALKKLRASRGGMGRFDERIREGELLIQDRICRGGGWNYGNPMVLGEDLPPYPDVTAVALIALQDRASEPLSQRSLAALEAMLDESASGLTLSWSILSLLLHGREVRSHRELLARRYAASGFLDEIRAIALALLALGGRVEALRL